jgi:Ca2+-binding RTX toxin-like protein
MGKGERGGSANVAGRNLFLGGVTTCGVSRSGRYGDTGQDALSGGGAIDILYGGSQFNDPEAATNHLYGFGGNDVLYGGAGEDHLLGDNGPLSNVGGGNDILHGGSGADFMDGQSGNDELHGGGDDDICTGGEGDDFVAGGAGNDNLGNTGTVFLSEPGNDTFVFDAGDFVAGNFGWILYATPFRPKMSDGPYAGCGIYYG